MQLITINEAAHFPHDVAIGQDALRHIAMMYIPCDKQIRFPADTKEELIIRNVEFVPVTDNYKWASLSCRLNLCSNVDSSKYDHSFQERSKSGRDLLVMILICYVRITAMEAIDRRVRLVTRLNNANR